MTITKREYTELRHSASTYRTQHRRALERIERITREHAAELARSRAREDALRAENAHLEALNRDLRQRVFGIKTEQSSSIEARAGVVLPEAPAPRPRGQQRGKPGHGRTRVSDLPAREEHHILDGAKCAHCGLPLQEIAGTQDAEILEIEVQAYRRVVRRHRYRPACGCGCMPGVVMPAVPQQLIPRGKLGVSIWVQALLSKYHYGQPAHRLLRDWAGQGLRVAQGTLTDGLRRLQPLFEPVVQAGFDQLRSASHWHADETRWQVYEDIEGKVGHRWYLWVFKSEQVVSFVLDPSRSAAVPAQVLQGVQTGVLSVDRYAAYGKFARQRPGVELAICWAHQRRDFLRAANDHPPLWGWAMGWVEQIGVLYALHARRRACADAPEDAARVDEQLRAALEAMRKRCDTELVDTKLACAATKVLRSMSHFWDGLTLFVDHPGIDLDNNASERALRTPVVGRKGYYGSGSQWSGALAAAMFGLFATLERWQVNPRAWLGDYLQACAQAGGQPPPQLDPFLPWRMDPQRLAHLRAAPTIDTS